MKLKQIFTTLSVALTATSLVACNGGTSSTTATTPNHAAKVDTTKPAIMGYYTNWATYEAGYQPSNIPNEVDEIIYAFAQVGGCSTDEADLPTEAEVVNGTAQCKVKVNGSGVTVQPGIQDYKLWSTDGYSDFYEYKSPQGNISFSGLGNIGKTLKLGKPVLLSIGGWTLSSPIRAAIKPERQDAFIQSIIDFMLTAEADAKAHGVSNRFAGVDIDWEPNGNLWTLPASNSKNVQLGKADIDNYATFLAKLKVKLTENGYSTLKIAVTASPTAIKNVDAITPDYWKNIAANGIYVDMMTYDYNAQSFGDSCKYTGFNSPLWVDPKNPCEDNKDFNIQSSVETMLAAGVPASQIGIGVPSYGRAYALNSVGDVTTDNLYPMFNADNLDKLQNVAVGGFGSVWTYREILTGRAFGANSDSENTTWTKVSDGFDVGQSVATAYINYSTPAWISYTSAANAASVMSFAKDKGLSGVMVWELDQDIQAGDTYADGTPVDLNKDSIVAGLAGGMVVPSKGHTLTVTETSGKVAIQVLGITNGADSVNQLDYQQAGKSFAYTDTSFVSIDDIDSKSNLSVTWAPWGDAGSKETCSTKFNFDKDTTIFINGASHECEIVQ